ncbi:hypothetical protein ACX27_03670 [Nostoc piscinale CENA21]|uniref:Uncharacterized protein n=1 Tax=Nostoc piscinale CENA21 TaxID=224013 RepID=A0A0M4SNZ8_9NOSO|nr:hypothetical protein ACX27_03670 [Nostoc piscinale CENA21]
MNKSKVKGQKAKKFGLFTFAFYLLTSSLLAQANIKKLPLPCWQRLFAVYRISDSLNWGLMLISLLAGRCFLNGYTAS